MFQKLKHFYYYKTFFVLFIFFLVLPFISHAQWSRNGNIIIQSGTSNSLAGLELINGVHTRQQGNKTFYYVETGVDYMQIDGTLQITPETEALIFTEDVIDDQALLVNGTLRIGVETVINGITRYSKGMALVMPNENNTQYETGSLRMGPNSRFEWRGGTIYSGNAMGNPSGTNATTEIWDGIFVNTDTDASTQFFRNENDPDDLIVHHITLDSNTAPQFGSIIFALNGINTFSADILAGRVQPRGGSFDNPLALKNLTFINNATNADVEFGGSLVNLNDDKVQGMELTNVDKGTGLIIEFASLVYPLGHLAIFQEITFHFTDENGSPLENVRAFMRTTDHGNRFDVASAKLRNYRSFTGTDFDTYTDLSDSSGDLPLQTVLTGTKYNVNDVAPVVVTSNLYGNNNVDGDDHFTWYFWHYNKKQVALEIQMKDSAPITTSIELLPDTSIAEPDVDVVAAYTHIENLDELYDYAKYWKTLEANIEIPAASELLLKPNGGTLDLGEYNLVIDPTAAEIFAVDTASKTITIRNGTSTDTTEKPIYAGDIFTEVLTTGLVSSNDNDNLIRFGFEDATGVNLHLEIKHLENTTVEVADFAGVPDGDPGIVLSSSTGSFTGTYEALFIQPADPSEIKITLTRPGHITFTEYFPTEQHSFIIDPILTPISDRNRNQKKILAYLLKVFQKMEILSNTFTTPQPALQTATATSTSIADGAGQSTLANQQEMLKLIREILRKSIAVEQTHN